LLGPGNKHDFHSQCNPQIQRVRNLETENNRLQVQVNEVEVVERREKENLAARYEVKIDDLRKQVDYLTREKAK